MNAALRQGAGSFLKGWEQVTAPLSSAGVCSHRGGPLLQPLTPPALPNGFYLSGSEPGNAVQVTC